MNRDSIRRFILKSPKRLFLFYTVGYALLYSLFTILFNTQSTVFYVVLFSILMATISTRATFKNKSWSMEHLDDGSYAKLQNYNKLFKNVTIPANVVENSDFKEYVEDRKKQALRVSKGFIFALILFGGMDVLSALFIRNLLLVISYTTIILCVIGITVNSRRNVRKADQILFLLDKRT